MRKDDVVDFFGTKARLAEFLGITRQAVEQWPDLIPEGAAYKLEVLTVGRLRVDPADYNKPRLNGSEG